MKERQKFFHSPALSEENAIQREKAEKPPFPQDSDKYFSQKVCGVWRENTDESLRPNLNHPEPMGPHRDYWGPDGTKVRIFPD